MRRVLVGSLWFLVLAFALLLLVQLGVALYVVVVAPAHANQQAMIRAGTAFAQLHLGLIRSLDLAALLAAGLMAGFGTFRGLLPGTRHSDRP